MSWPGEEQRGGRVDPGGEVQWAKGHVVTPASSDSLGFFLFLPNPHPPILLVLEGSSLAGQVEAPPLP